MMSSVQLLPRNGHLAVVKYRPSDFQELNDSSSNTVNVRDLHQHTDLNTYERRRT
jgi:hypothetical protein